MNIITINQRRGLWFLAAVLAFALCSGSVAFYTSFSNSRFEYFYFAVMAVGLFAMTVLSPSAIIWAWRPKVWGWAIAAGIFIVPLLLFLEIFAGAGLLKFAHQSKQLHGEHAKALAAEVQAKEAAAAQFGGEAVNVAELQAAIAKNDAAIESLREIAAKCKKSNMLTNCHKDGDGMLSVEMVKAKQRELQAENSAAQNKIENAGKLVAVLEGKAQAQMKYAEAATTGGTGDIPQIFVTLGNFLNMSPMAARDLQIVLTQLLVQTCLAVLLAFLIHSEPAAAILAQGATPEAQPSAAITPASQGKTCGTCFRHGSNSKTVECWYHNAPANKPACEHHAITQPASIPPAKVLRPGDELPALDTGARVVRDGTAIIHAGEVVLNRQATAAIDSLYPGLLDKANAGVPVGTIEPASGSNKPDIGTIKPKAKKPAGTLEPQAVRQQFDTTSEPGTVRHRYDYIKALILDGKISGKITARRIRDIPYNGMRMGHAPAKRFFNQLVKDGVIKDE